MCKRTTTFVFICEQATMLSSGSIFQHSYGNYELWPRYTNQWKFSQRNSCRLQPIRPDAFCDITQSDIGRKYACVNGFSVFIITSTRNIRSLWTVSRHSLLLYSLNFSQTCVVSIDSNESLTAFSFTKSWHSVSILWPIIIFFSECTWKKTKF